MIKIDSPTSNNVSFMKNNAIANANVNAKSILEYLFEHSHKKLGRKYSVAEKKAMIAQRNIMKQELTKPDASMWKYAMFIDNSTNKYTYTLANNGKIYNLMKELCKKTKEIYPKTGELRTALADYGMIKPNKVTKKHPKWLKAIVKALA